MAYLPLALVVAISLICVYPLSYELYPQKLMLLERAVAIVVIATGVESPLERLRGIMLSDCTAERLTFRIHAG